VQYGAEAQRIFRLFRNHDTQSPNIGEGMFWAVQIKSKKYMIAVTVAAPAIT
jgi:hypothetical protein